MEDKNNKPDVAVKLIVNKATDYLNKVIARDNEKDASDLNNKMLSTLNNVDMNTRTTNTLLSTMKKSLQPQQTTAKNLIRTDESGEGSYKTKMLRILGSIDEKSGEKGGIGGMIMGLMSFLGGVFKFFKNPLKFLTGPFYSLFTFLLKGFKNLFVKIFDLVSGLISKIIPQPIKDFFNKHMPMGEKKRLKLAKERQIKAIDRGSRNRTTGNSQWTDERQARRTARSNKASEMTDALTNKGKIPKGYEINKEGKIFKSVAKESRFAKLGTKAGGLFENSGKTVKALTRAPGKVIKAVTEAPGKLIKTGANVIKKPAIAIAEKIGGKALVKGGLKAAARATEAIPVLGEVVMVAMTAADAISGWNRAGEILGKETKDLKISDRMRAAGAEAASGLTFGLVSAKKIVEVQNTVIDYGMKGAKLIQKGENKVLSFMTGGMISEKQITDTQNEVLGKLAHVGRFIDQVATDAYNAITDVTGKWFDKQVNDWTNGFNYMKTSIGDWANEFIEDWKVGFDFIKTGIKDWVLKFVDDWKVGFSYIIDGIKSIGNKILNMLPPPVKKKLKEVIDIMDTARIFIVDKLTAAFNGIRNFFDGVMNYIKGSKVLNYILNTWNKTSSTAGTSETKPQEKTAEEKKVEAVKIQKDKETVAKNAKFEATPENAFSVKKSLDRFGGVKGGSLATTQMLMEFLLSKYAPYSAELNAAALNKEDADAMSKVPIRIVEPMR